MTTIIKSSRKRTMAGTACGVVIVSLLIVGNSTTGDPARLSRTVRAQDGIQSAARPSILPRRFSCTNGTVAGRYATKGDGFAPGGPPPAPLVPFAVVSIMTLETSDGVGRLSNAVTSSLNGVLSSGINPGTYTVNDDCTGKMSINIPAPPFQLNFDFVVADQGNEFYAIATTPSVVTLVGKRLQ